jgi:hypothetical protein
MIVKVACFDTLLQVLILKGVSLDAVLSLTLDGGRPGTDGLAEGAPGPALAGKLERDVHGSR